jgi:hypothetical protein
MSITTDKLLRLYGILNSRKYYSLEINYLSKRVGIPVKTLRSIYTNQNAINFFDLIKDDINIFFYNDIEYVGLESRKIDYDRDKDLGVNWVENAINEGKYNK